MEEAARLKTGEKLGNGKPGRSQEKTGRQVPAVAKPIIYLMRLKSNIRIICGILRSKAKVSNSLRISVSARML
jgi:hypothetical protein